MSLSKSRKQTPLRHKIFAMNKINILLIEDDEDDFLITRDLLDDIDNTAYALEWVPDLIQARTALTQNKHDVCLMDYSLGAVDGLTLLKEVKCLGFNAPVIMLTGQDDTQLDTLASKAGAVDYLVKSQLSASRLARAIRYAITRKQFEAERVERLKAESASQAKSKFLTHLSHELRTPLTAILGYTDLLLSESHPANSIEKLDIIKRNGDHLLSLLNDVLDLSKIEANKLDIEKQTTQLTPLLSNLLQLLRVKANDKGITLQFNNAGKVPRSILTDPLRLQQILLNLLGNAIKFTNEGSVTLNITAHADKQEIDFDVIDTGIGINTQQLDQIFIPFAQIPTTNQLTPGQTPSHNEAGSGLGLAISSQLTQRLGGKIAVSSQVGKGSRFTVTLPLHHDEQKESPQWINLNLGNPQTHKTVTPAPKLTGRVLVADDIPEIRTLITQIVKMTGVEVDSAVDGQHAWELINNHRKDYYDVIFLDVQMPRLSGPELAARLRASDFNQPLVALTAATMQDQKNLCYQQGFNNHLSKPIDRDHLWQTLKNLLPVKSKAKRLLVVEDNKDALDVTCQILELLGAQVATASNGEQAQAQAKQHYDAVLLDLNLPDIHGSQLAPLLRQDLPATTKIIAVTGQDITHSDRGVLNIDDCVIKPLNIDKLKSLLKTL